MLSPVRNDAPGTLIPFAGTTALAGTLFADGSAVSRTTYAALFSLIGTTYGAGDGSTTFNLPDCRSRTPIGKSPGSLSGNRTAVRNVADTGGEETHALTTPELANHTHTFGSKVVGSQAGASSGNTQMVTGLASQGGTTAAAGSGTAHNNMQPYLVCQWLIKV